MSDNPTTHDPGIDAGPPWEVVEPAADQQAAGPATSDSTSLAVFDPIEQTLAQIEARHKNVVYDLTTTKGNDAARKARKELVSVRTAADEVYETWNKPLLAAQKQARALRDGFKARVQLLEEPLDKAIKADEERRAAEKKAREDAEAARIKAIRARIADIYAQPAACVGMPSKEIDLSIVGVEVLIADKPFYEELLGEAEAAADVVLTKLGAMKAAALAAEEQAERQRLEAERLAAERAELERQRAELAAQQEAAREAARLAAEQAAAARRAEEERLAAERAAAEAAERKRLAEEAERVRLAQEAAAAAEREAAERLAEQQRQLDAERAAFEAEQAAAREAAAAAAAAASTLVRTEKPGPNGCTIVNYLTQAQLEAARVEEGVRSMLDAMPAEPVAAAEPEPALDESAEPVRPPTKQVDAFVEERQAEVARAAAQPKPPAKRPDDERITAAVARAFDVEPAIAAEWLGTYDAFEEIARIQGVPA